MEKKNFLIRLPLACNFDCLFCFLDGSGRDGSKAAELDVYLRTIDSIPDKEMCHLVLSGGEPTLFRPLPFLVAYAKQSGIGVVEIQTNALRCYYKDYVKRLKEAGLDAALVGLHAHTEKTFDRLTQTTGHLPRVLQGIENLFRYRIRVSFNHTITTLTFRELPAQTRFLVSHFPACRSLFFTLAYPCGTCWANKRIIPRASAVAPYFLEALRIARAEKVPFRIPHCGMPGFPLCLLPLDGRDDPEGLISSQRKLISSSEFPCANIKATRCRLCVYDHVCIGIASNYKKLYGLGEFEPRREKGS